MSWDVYVTFKFSREQTPLARLIEFCHAGHAFFLIQVLHDNYLREPMIKRIAPEGTALSLEEIVSLSKEFQNKESAAEGWESTCRFDLDEDNRPASFEYRNVLRCITPSFHWPTVIKHSCHVVYDAGDYKHYLPSLRRDAALLNIDRLIGECAQLLPLEVETIRGLDAEHSADPSKCWFVFHRQLEAYSQDLNQIGLRHGVLSQDVILDASLESNKVSLLETDCGPIIYSKNGVEGNLCEFYEILARKSI